MNSIKTKGSKYPERITPRRNSPHLTIIYALGAIYLCCLSTVEMPHWCVPGRLFPTPHPGSPPVAWNLPRMESLPYRIWETHQQGSPTQSRC